MKQKLLYLACAALLMNIRIFAQSTELMIGDKVPDIVLNNIIYYKTSKAKISDFKDKLLILDFWATWCGPCIAEFPKLDSLQKIFQDDVQIIAVTDQGKKIVKDFFLKYGKLKNIKPRPSVTGDTVLRNIFRHNYLPHFVWINGNGTVAAITDAEQVNAENIKKYLSGSKLSLPEKKDNVKLIDRAQPVFSIAIPVFKKQDENNYIRQLDSVDANDLLFHSTFTRHIEGLPGYATNHLSRIACMNYTIENLFSAAYGYFKPEFVYGNRSIWEVSDPSLQRFRNDELYKRNKTLIEMKNWKKENTFCYELTIPFSSNREQNYEIMKNDLNRYFGMLYNIEGHIEKRKVKCLALVHTSSADKIAVKDSSVTPVDVGGGLFHVKVVNKPIINVVENLRNALQGSFLPLVDETGYTRHVDIELKGNLSELNALNALLEKYDLKFIEKESVLDMVIIKDKSKK